MASVSLVDVRKVYPNGHIATRDLRLDIADGELMVLVGPSGSGKSTALRLIAGLESPTAGRILIGGDDVTAVPPQNRDLAMVFQSYALYPHKTVHENLAFPLRMQRLSRPAIEERVRRVAASLDIAELLDRKPAQLSGGQRQRVALGRAAVREPRAFLFDEPLSNLDPALRVRTRAELSLLHRRLGATMIYVTHDQEEAMTLGDRIAVMRDGTLQQVASPMQLYRHPANVFVATFIGSPAMNLFRCELISDGEAWRARCGAFDVVLSPAGDDARTAAGDARQPTQERRHGAETPAQPASRTPDDRVHGMRPGPAVLGVRPQDLTVHSAGEGGDARAVVQIVEPLGSELRLHLDVANVAEAGSVLGVVPPDTQIASDDQVAIRFPAPDRLHLFDADSGERLG
jgi:multiple sugar transport system ATP-binding protein